MPDECKDVLYYLPSVRNEEIFFVEYFLPFLGSTGHMAKPVCVSLADVFVNFFYFFMYTRSSTSSHVYDHWVYIQIHIHNHKFNFKLKARKGEESKRNSIGKWKTKWRKYFN